MRNLGSIEVSDGIILLERVVQSDRKNSVSRFKFYFTLLFLLLYDKICFENDESVYTV